MTGILLVLIGVIIFGLIIFLHEFGHFFTAKLSGVRVNEFAIGMGPKLFSFAKGETLYTLRLLPIGGYCAMEGEDEDSDDEAAFNNKAVWKRMIIVVMGAIMNLIFGFLLMIISTSQTELIGTTQIAAFADNSKMEAAGAMTYDYVYSIDGYRCYTDRDMSFALSTADPDNVDLVLLRKGEKVYLEDVKFDSYVVEQTGRKAVVIDFQIFGTEPNVGNVIQKSFMDTYSLVRTVGKSLIGIVSGEYGINDLSGPVGAAQAITEVTSESLKSGFGVALSNLVSMLALISVNLGVFNLLPFPALDGGRFLFLLIEAIIRKPIPRKFEGYVNGAGLVILLGLMAVITLKDIFGLF